MQPQTYPALRLSKANILWNVILMGFWGVIAAALLGMGGLVRMFGILLAVGWVAGIVAFIRWLTKSRGTLRITDEFVVFGGNRIYYKDMESIERGSPDRTGASFQVIIRTPERRFPLDLGEYAIDPAWFGSVLDDMRGAHTRVRQQVRAAGELDDIFGVG